jgi:hypothetical protein
VPVQLMLLKGRCVRISGARLKSQVLLRSADKVYVRAGIDGEYVGHVFATRWVYQPQ